MKFGKKLRATVDNSYEEWRPMFMSYKDLKKCIHPLKQDDLQSNHSNSKHMDNDPDSDPDPATTALPLSSADKMRNTNAVRHAETAHNRFFSTFRHEVDKVNEFFLDKQEDYIIEHRQLSEKVDEYLIPARPTRPEVNRLRQRLINFHGELVLLENFSTVNYTGFRKILKKHDKKTGTNIRNIYLKTVLITPFFLSNTVRSLILKTESQLAALDTIRKFRRLSPPSTLTPQPPVPPTPESSKHASTTASPAPIPLAPAALSPCTKVVMEPPRPHAFISPRSALWRLYSEARTFGTTMRDPLSKFPIPQSLPSIPQSLVDLVDATSATELGLESTFLKAVNQPSYYCIAGDDTFSMGFFIVKPGTKLQIFKSLHGGAFISRNLCGRATLSVYETADNLDTNKKIAPGSHTSEKKDEFLVERKRSGKTVGPWPAVPCLSRNMHVEWEPETACAIFYVCMPSLKPENERIPCYQLQQLEATRFRVVCDADKSVSFLKVNC